MKQTVLKFGAIAGVILSAMMAFSILVIGDNGSLGALIGYTTMILAFSLAYFGVRSYRDTVAKGSISFGLVNIPIELLTIDDLAQWLATD